MLLALIVQFYLLYLTFPLANEYSTGYSSGYNIITVIIIVIIGRSFKL